jgi:phage-related protein
VAAANRSLVYPMERTALHCMSNRLALGAERVHSAWRDEDLPDFHASLREPKHLGTNGLRKWIDPPAGERSRCDACPSAWMPKDAKPFKGVGSGVFELAVRYDADAFRTVLAVQLGKKIYVLHAFQKKSKKGIETPKHEVELIKQRYAEAKELARHEEK